LPTLILSSLRRGRRKLSLPSKCVFICPLPFPACYMLLPFHPFILFFAVIFLNPTLCDFTSNTSAVLANYGDTVCRVVWYPSFRPSPSNSAPNMRSARLGVEPFLLLVTQICSTIILTSVVVVGVGHILWRQDRCPVCWLVFVRYVCLNMFIRRRTNQSVYRNFMHLVLLKNKQKQINNRKENLIKNNNLTSYMFRPSRGHLQADIWNKLGSIQVMCGGEISLLTGFCYNSSLYI
jgi:hypothetical protein